MTLMRSGIVLAQGNEPPDRTKQSRSETQRPTLSNHREVQIIGKIRFSVPKVPVPKRMSMSVDMRSVYRTQTETYQSGTTVTLVIIE